MQCGGAREEASGKPEQLPTSGLILAVVVRELLQDLTVNLIPQRLLKRRERERVIANALIRNMANTVLNLHEQVPAQISGRRDLCLVEVSLKGSHPCT